MNNTIKVIERATGVEYVAKAITGGYEVYTIEDKGETPELYKKLKESTFKKYFRVLPETKDQANSSNKDEKAATQENTHRKENKQVNADAEPVSEEKRTKMIDKIKKMLALAENNPSMEEGLSAALQAQRLMVKYNIHEDEVTLEEIKDTDAIGSVFSHQKHNSQLHSWRKVLASIIARNFRCKCYLRGLDVVFRGYKHDAEIALSVYMSLYTIGNSLGSKAYTYQLQTTGSGKGAYNSFVTGFLKGVDEGFSTQCTALMVIVPKEVEEEFVEFSSGFKKASTTKLSVVDADLYNKGRIEGKMVVKSRQIEKGSKK